MRLLLIAEKPSVAKQLAYILADKAIQPVRIHNYQVFTFKQVINQVDYSFTISHTIGHVTNYQFEQSRCDQPEDQFSSTIKPVFTSLGNQFFKVMKKLVPDSDKLILCLDNDREGEHISYEVVEVASNFKQVSIFPSKLPRVRRQLQQKIIDKQSSYQAYRMRFSALNKQEVIKAFTNIDSLNVFQVEAVDVRQQLDLRIGFAFSGLQIRNTNKILLDLKEGKNQAKLTFGTCQTPTLGLLYFNKLVKEQEKARIVMKTQQLNLESEPKLKLQTQKEAIDIQKELIIRPYVYVSGTSKQLTENPPKPLNTVNLQKDLVSQIPGKQLMQIAESLYQGGYISYPRTETQNYPKSMDLDKILKIIQQYQSQQFSQLVSYSQTLEKSQRYTHSGQSDEAHPPIHPLRLPRDFQSKQHEIVYIHILKHFLATIGLPCLKTQISYTYKNNQTILTDQKVFIHTPGWRGVYGILPQDIPEVNDTMIEKVENMVLNDVIPQNPPSTEAGLIAKMDRYGIGTDATIAEHIQTVQDRKFVKKYKNNLTVTKSGESLIKLYEKVNLAVISTVFRAGVEAGLRDIEADKITPDDVYTACLKFSMEIFQQLKRRIANI